MLKIVISAASIILLIVSVLLILVCHLKRKQDQNKGMKDDIELEYKVKAIPSK